MKLDEIEVGMLIESEGLIREVYIAGTDSEQDHMWSGNNALYFYMIEDGYSGCFAGVAQPDDDYTELHLRGSEQYNKIVTTMMCHRQQELQWVTKDIEFYSNILKNG
jgi:hypothetical protein